MSSSLSLRRMVVLPALSRPRIRMRACGGRGELVSKVPETRRSAGPRAVVVSFPPARSAEWGRERGPGSDLASGLLESPKKTKKTLRTRGMGTVWVRGRRQRRAGRRARGRTELRETSSVGTPEGNGMPRGGRRGDARDAHHDFCACSPSVLRSRKPPCVAPPGRRRVMWLRREPFGHIFPESRAPRTESHRARGSIQAATQRAEPSRAKNHTATSLRFSQRERTKWDR